MATVVVLVPAADSQPSLQPAALTALAAQGVTGIAVVGDGRTLGFVVEGWAFDAQGSAAAVEAAISVPGRARTLYPLLDLAVSQSALGSGRGST